MTLQATLGPAKSPAPGRHLRSVLGVVALVLGLGAAPSALSTPITLTFDEIGDGTVLTTQYQGIGVTISGATVMPVAYTPWLTNTTPYLAFAPTGLMTFTLTPLITGDIQSVSAYVSGLTSVGIFAYDAAGFLVGQGLTPGATDNMLLSFTSSGNPIASIVIHDGGGSFAIDTLTFTSVPEPATAWLLGFGLLGLMGLPSVARRKSTTNRPRYASTPAPRKHPRSAVGVLSILLGLGAGQSALATTTTLTFDEYAHGTTITTQYQGVGATVSGLDVLGGIFSPWPSNTGANVAYAPTGLMTFTLNSAITGNIQDVWAYVSGTTSVGVYAYDIGGVLVGQSLTPSATDNMFLAFATSGNPIASISIHDGGSSFAIDTLTFNSVPEPGTAWLMGFGLLGLLGLQSVAWRKSTTNRPRYASTPAPRKHPRSAVGVLSILLGLGAGQSALATTTTLTFDEYANGTDITNQYQSVGVMATGVNVLDVIFSPWPANTGANIAAAPTGLMTFTLNPAITGNIQDVSAYVSGTTSVGVYAYDIGGALVGQTLTPGATDNMFLTVASSGNPIASLAIHDGGSNFAIDTLTFTSVPEPATAWLLGFGLLGLLGGARRKETT